MISSKLKSAEALLRDVRSNQRTLLERAAKDGNGRTFTYGEEEDFELLEVEAKSLESEIAMLNEQLEMEAATAQPPNSNPDWR